MSTIANKRPLRFITCGSVDDGKSTLIGRLLYDSKALMIDQIDALSRARGAQTRDGKIDLSLITDGLEAEREQGITIDVAYRYFTTPKRKFIIADAPGHEQYTRNMVTGASKSDVAVILIDVTKLDFTQRNVKLLAQTKRHAALAGLLGLKHIVVAVNKMDAIDFDETKFERVAAAFSALAESLTLPAFTAIPVSALDGDGVVAHTERTRWFNGPSFLQCLEALDIDSSNQRDATRQPSHIAIQYVTRDAVDDHQRWFTGDVADAALNVGDRITVFPGEAVATVSAIRTARGDTPRAEVGEAVAIALDRQVDIARGDWIIAKSSHTTGTTGTTGATATTDATDASDAIRAERTCTATIAWLDNAPLNLGRRLLAKHGTRWVPVRVARVRERLNLSEARWSEEVSLNAAEAANANDLIRADIEFASDLPLAMFSDSHARGAFVLVDPSTNATAAAGMIH
jgi:sulfate adenylyltransferase subunit 1